MNPLTPNHNRRVEQERLRDEFAMAALPGLVGGRSWDTTKFSDIEIIKQWAKSAYLVADAMLVQREINKP